MSKKLHGTRCEEFEAFNLGKGYSAYLNKDTHYLTITDGVASFCLKQGTSYKLRVEEYAGYPTDVYLEGVFLGALPKNIPASCIEEFFYENIQVW